MRIYRIPFSTNVERVSLAVGHKGLEVEWIDVDPDDRSPVEAVSGQRLVPVLVAEDGEVVYDSPAILEWIEARNPEPPLLPRDPARRAEVRIFADWFNRVWKRAPNEIADHGATDALAAEMRGAIELFEALLAGREYLFGEFGLADVVAFPFLKYASLGLPPADDELFHRVLVDHQPLRDDSPLHAWVRRVDAHPRG
ncbi:MAG TPA: glutathione S-transferase family protein [Gaiellaceae bacterium]|jgi:glutathione S-transferase|nr:glutathione S-transferase family protein [Gaiellaceae bacterium]